MLLIFMHLWTYTQKTMVVYLLVLNLEVEMATEPIIERRMLNITSSFQLNKKPQKHILNPKEKNHVLI